MTSENDRCPITLREAFDKSVGNLQPLFIILFLMLAFITVNEHFQFLHTRTVDTTNLPRACWYEVNEEMPVDAYGNRLEYICNKA